MNVITISGNIGSVKKGLKTETGTAKAFLQLATNDFYNKQTYTNWHNLAVFGSVAEYCQTNAEKGDYATATGRLFYNSETKQATIMVDTIEIVKRKIGQQPPPISRDSGY